MLQFSPCEIDLCIAESQNLKVLAKKRRGKKMQCDSLYKIQHQDNYIFMDSYICNCFQKKQEISIQNSA